LYKINGELGELVDLLVRRLGHNDVSAYIVMMSVRLIELHRILKPTGSLYLHCDPTASHYLKIILDVIFSSQNFRNEIIWKRTSSHSDAKKYAKIKDVLLYYSKSEKLTWNSSRLGYTVEYINKYYANIDTEQRRYTLDNLTKPKGSQGYYYNLLGCEPPPNGWRMPESRAEEWIKEGRIVIPPTGKTPRYKRYLDEVEGRVISDVWDDISPINSQAKERLGYPTQKPLALLERIIQASSNPDDIVLDPFCGCGTALHAAQKLKRTWIGIDITHLAISLIESRLKTAFPGIQFEVFGTPKDLDGAKDLAQRDKYQFQWWACSLVEVPPYQGKKKGADSGIDGLRYIADLENGKEIRRKIIVSVKGGENVGAAMVRDLIGTMQTNKADIGLFVTLAEPTKPMLVEATKLGFYKAGNGKEYPRVQILTIEELLNNKKRPEYFDMSLGEITFKRAEKESILANQSNLFDS